MHDYRATGTDGANTFMGMNAGSLTMAGTGTEADVVMVTSHGDIRTLQAAAAAGAVAFIAKEDRMSVSDVVSSMLRRRQRTIIY